MKYLSKAKGPSQTATALYFATPKLTYVGDLAYASAQQLVQKLPQKPQIRSIQHRSKMKSNQGQTRFPYILLLVNPNLAHPKADVNND